MISNVLSQSDFIMLQKFDFISVVTELWQSSVICVSVMGQSL